MQIAEERDVETQWILTPRPNPHAAMRLICVPPAGGGAASFRGWSDRLRIAELGVVELPGRGGRLSEPMLESVAAAADGLAEALTQGPVTPTALVGQGLGALIAFEAARRLEARNWPMLALFVSGRRAPSLPCSCQQRSGLAAERLIEEMRQRTELASPETALDRESLQLLIPAVRADFAMLDGYAYEPGTRLRCPIVAFGNEPGASGTDMTAWREETSGRFSLRTFTGDASYLQREREAVTAIIANQLSVLVSAMARWSAAR
jgi:surfactin synthase thioesterase subunit